MPPPKTIGEINELWQNRDLLKPHELMPEQVVAEWIVDPEGHADDLVQPILFAVIQCGQKDKKRAPDIWTVSLRTAANKIEQRYMIDDGLVLEDGKAGIFREPELDKPAQGTSVSEQTGRRLGNLTRGLFKR